MFSNGRNVDEVSNMDGFCEERIVKEETDCEDSKLQLKTKCLDEEMKESTKGLLRMVPKDACYQRMAYVLIALEDFFT